MQPSHDKSFDISHKRKTNQSEFSRANNKNENNSKNMSFGEIKMKKKHSQATNSSKESQKTNNVCFVFPNYEITIPFERLGRDQVLQNIDLKYYLEQCHIYLKKIYDLDFKPSTHFKELKNFLLQDELQ